MALAPDIITAQMESMRGMYAELFMLMLQNIEDQQERELESQAGDGIGSLDLAIEDLMQAIDGNMRDFRERVALVRDEKLSSVKLDREIGIFSDQIREGLTAMHRRVEARRQQIQTELESVRERLKLVQRKRTGTRGYRLPTNPRGISLTGEG